MRSSYDFLVMNKFRKYGLSQFRVLAVVIELFIENIIKALIFCHVAYGGRDNGYLKVIVFKKFAI